MGTAVLFGAVLAVAIIAGAALLILHATFGGSSRYCVEQVKVRLAQLANALEAPDGAKSGPAAKPTCLDSQDGAWTDRRFELDGRHSVSAAVRQLRAQLKAGGWLGRPPLSLDTDELYVHDFDGNRYWVELDAGRHHIWLSVSAGGPL
jgi:hypothetical protein